jgi:hypothetical protein
MQLEKISLGTTHAIRKVSVATRDKSRLQSHLQLKKSREKVRVTTTLVTRKKSQLQLYLQLQKNLICKHKCN